MVANIRGFTPNYNFKLINFDVPRWHTLEYANWQQVDAMFLSMGTPPIRGEWRNSTLYLEGDRVFDAQTSEIYRALVKHTSAPTGLFEADRDAHPDYWVLQTLGVPTYRGLWEPGVAYYLGDLVYTDDFVYHLCIDSHTSGVTFAENADDWQTVFDPSDAVEAVDADRVLAEAAAVAAAASEAAAATSAANAATSETNAATSELNAATSESHAADSAASAAGSAINAAASADAAAASAAAVAGQAESLRGTSTTPNDITTGTMTFTTEPDKQFNPGVFMTIVSTTDMSQVLSAQVISYVGDQLVVDVKKAEGSGNYADWQLYVSASIGLDGDQGPAGTSNVHTSTTPPASPQDGALWWDSDTGDLYVYYQDIDSGQWVLAAPQPNTDTFVQKTGDTMTGHLTLPTGPNNADATRRDYVDSSISIAVGAIDFTPYAHKDSPIFTGDPRAPMPALTDNDDTIATTAWVKAAGGGFTTGDVKLTFKTVADNSWVMMNDGTIGNTASGASYPLAECHGLYLLLWANVSDAYCTVTGGRTTAEGDWTANKRMLLPKSLGRALAIAGSGAGLSGRALGQTLGEEAHTLTVGEQQNMGVSVGVSTSVNVSVSVYSNVSVYTEFGSSGSTSEAVLGVGLYAGGPGTGGGEQSTVGGVNVSTGALGASVYGGGWGSGGGAGSGSGSGTGTGSGSGGTTNGGGQAHNNMQPSAFFNVMIKL